MPTERARPEVDSRDDRPRACAGPHRSRRVASRRVLCVTSHDPSTRPVPRPRVHANELDALDRSTRLDALDRSTRLDALDRSSRYRSIESVSIDRVGIDRVDSSRVRSRERTPRL
jgi:hypothetical protein